MFGFRKKHSQDAPAREDQEQKRGLFKRLRAGLARTRAGLSDALGDLLTGRRQIDDELLDEIETLLLTADVGVNATRRIIDDLTARVRRKELADPEALGAALRERLTEILRGTEAPFAEPTAGRPLVVLMGGINGAGKSTLLRLIGLLERATR
ncbi:MAG: signal recognition particle receptor subunit alpha, partial [Sedimenticolaceae bacterium]